MALRERGDQQLLGVPAVGVAAEGAVVVKKSPAEFGAFMESEMKKWELVVKKGNIKAE